MLPSTMALNLPAADLRLLRSMLRATTLGAALVRRARVVIALSDGETYAAIAAAHSVSDRCIALWKRRVEDGGRQPVLPSPLLISGEPRAKETLG
jgi:Helix-turn-helix domain